MALDPTADRPLSLQLADALRREIREGTRPPGSQLPSESGFQEGYGVSRTTARAALQQLVNEGLVVTRKGYGSYVRERPPVRRISSNRRHATHRASGKRPRPVPQRPFPYDRVISLFFEALLMLF